MRCAHCCFSCTPQSQERLAVGTAERIAESAAADSRVDNIALTGGEVLLDKPTVLRVLRIAKQAGKGASLVTNGFWAKTPKSAQAVVDELWEAGLRTLTVSYDEFHTPRISLERIKNVLNTSRRSPMRYALNVATTPARPAHRLLGDLGPAVFNIPITVFQTLPAGGAAAFDPSEFPGIYSENDPLKCPELSLVYHFDGSVYPCCSPTVTETSLSIGSVDTLSVPAGLDALASNKLLFLMRRTGLNWLLKEARAAGFDLPKTEWVSPCEACHALFRDDKVVVALRSRIVKKVDDVLMSGGAGQ
jgi:YydG family peptide modification radical SAM enzyme